MSKRLMKKRPMLITILAFSALVIGFQNCGIEGSFSKSGSLTQPSVTPGPTITTTGTDEPAEDTRKVGVNHSQNMLVTMQNQLGVAAISAGTRTTLATQIGKVPEQGTAESVTAPMWIAVTQISGEVCNDLVVQETPVAPDSHRIFRGVNFQVNGAITDVQKADVVRRLARSVWSRNETADEKKDLIDALNANFPQAAGTTGAQKQVAMIFLCTAMTASLDAQKM